MASQVEMKQVLSSDALIDDRDRYGRFAFFLLSTVAVIGGSALIMAKIANDFFGLGQIGFVAGLAVGALVFFTTLYNRMIVRVETQRAFQTLDLLKVFFKMPRQYVTYGPGTHFSYPWEKRIGRNNVNLEEVTEYFEVSVVTTTGIVHVRGSYRIRPRLSTDGILAFLGGVAVIADDISDLIKSVITDLLSTKTLDNVSQEITGINEALQIKFGKGTTADAKVSEYEQRFGIMIADVTVASIELSEGAMKTRNAVDEAMQFARGVALTLGYISTDAQRQALQDGKLTHEQIDTARKQFLALSENIVMTNDVKDFNIKIAGLENMDPEIIRAIGGAAQAYAATVARTQPQKGKNK